VKLDMQGQRQLLGSTKITRGALYLLIAMGAVSLFYQLSNESLRQEIGQALAATGYSVWHELKLWQLVTSPLLELSFIGLIFQGFMLWMFLPALERWWGTKRFLKFALYTSLAGTLAGTILAAVWPHSLPVGTSIGGLAPFTYAGIVAYGILFANQPVQFFGVLPMTGRQLTIGICVIVGLMGLFNQMYAQVASYAAAMLLAWAMVNGKWSPKLWWLKRKQKKIRAKLRVVRDDDDPKKWLN
jgi:membrane associated rhomboid family serine protease